MRPSGGRIVAVSVGLVSFLGCPTGATVDRAAAVEALLQAEADFLAETTARGAEGWSDFFLPDGVQFPGSGRLDGRDAIRSAMLSVLAPDRPRLVWTPRDAYVGSGGDLGYTLGRWQAVATDASGTDSVVSEGHYVTVWRQTPDGTWRVAVDIGNTDAE